MRCYGMNSTQPKGMLVQAWKWKSGIQRIQGILLNTLDLWSGTLSLLGILLHSLLWSWNWIPTSSILLASLSFSFSFYQPITNNVQIYGVCICICWVCCSILVSGINAMVGDWTVLYRPLLAVKSQKLFLVSMNHGVVKMVPVHCNLHKECVFVLFCAIVLNVKASVFPCIAGLLVLLSGIFLAHTKWPGFLGVRSWWGWCQPLNHLVENVRRSCRRYVVRRVDWVCCVSEHC